VDADAMAAYVADGFEGVIEVRSSGDSFFMYDPRGDLPDDRQFPFATIVTGDRYDQVSKLDRPSVYRLNIGLPKLTYVTRFGAPPTRRDGAGILESPFDYTAVDQVMPHPVYGAQYWVCVLNPGESTLGLVPELLAAAHAFAVRKDENQHARRGSDIG
jgi:hypothetical protein